LNLAGLITFWALVIAAYAVLPQYWKFRIKAFVGPGLAIISTCLAILLSLWLVSWSMFMEEGNCKIWTQIGAFLVLFLYIALVVLTLFRGRVTRNNINRFRELISSLSVSQQYEILTAAIRDNISHLTEIYDYTPNSRRLPWFRKQKQERKGALPLYQSPSKYQEEVDRLADQVITDLDFTKFVITYDINTPLAFIETFETKVTGVAEYLDIILELLISDSGSKLYREIQRHQNIGRGRRRTIGTSRLLRFLFEDAELARKRAIWKPIGDSVMRFLHARPGGLDDIYNKEANYYTDSFTTDKFSDPVFIGLEFFDFMVKEALLQSVKWHMWLYYLHHWTKEIVAKVSYDSTEWERGYWEYPTRYTFLLYRVISYQLEWFDCAREHDLNIGLEKGDIDINANILQSAAKCLSYCLHTISECKELPDKFKQSLFTLWWNNYFELDISNKNNYQHYAQSILESIITEVEGGYVSKTSFPLLGCLTSGLTHVDEIKEWVNSDTYKDRLSDMKTLLQRHVLSPLEAIIPEKRPEALVNMLGTEFQLDNDTISVTNRFGRRTDLVGLT